MYKLLPHLPWFYITRALGIAMVVYGIAFDDSAERGTIILGGLGILGVDKVARSEPASEKGQPPKNGKE